MSADATPGNNEKPWLKSYPVDIDWNIDIPVMTMPALFDAAVKKYAERPCLNFYGKKLTYKEVGKLVEKFARGLQDQGIGPNSTVGICMANTPYCIIAYYAAMKTGARVANFDPTSPPEALAQQITDSKTDVMVTVNLAQVQSSVEKALEISPLKKIVSCHFAEALPSKKEKGAKLITSLCNFAESKTGAFLLRKKGVEKVLGLRKKKGVPPMVATSGKNGKVISFAKLVKNSGKVKPVDIRPEDIALLQYTGGTTGVPKGAALTHANLSANIHQAYSWFGAANDGTPQKMLAILPFFHVFAMTVQMNLSLHMGAELNMLPKPSDEKGTLKPTLDAINNERPTIFAAVPALYKKMAEAKDIANYDLSSLRLCLSGGAPLPDKVREQWMRLTGTDLIEGYGLSETAPLAIANPIKGVKKPGSIGMPVPRTEIAFADVDTGVKLPGPGVPVGYEGEICLRGPQVMKEYFGRADETAKVFDEDGFFHTGDIGVMDEDGYIFITDRKKDMIIVNGLKAFPKKIEEAIRQFDGVSEVIVIGIPNEKTGELVKAFIQPKEGVKLDPSAITEFLRGKLKDYEVPRPNNMEFRDSLPLTKIGKPDKKPLKEEEKQKAKARQNAPKAP